MIRRAGLWIACVATLAALSPALANAACRQALALGLDVSTSVDASEYRLQRDGLAAALQSPQVVAAFETMPDIPVMLSVFEWSGYRSQRVLVPWTVIRSAADITAIAAELRAPDDGRKDNATALGGAALYAARAFAQVPHCWRKTLDLSGDGINNDGPTPRMLDTDPRLDGVTINGLVVNTPSAQGTAPQNVSVGDLVGYFDQNVIRGPGAFTEVAQGFEDFEAAMQRKLLREIRVPQFSALAKGSR